MAIQPNELPGLVDQMSAMVNSPQGSTPNEAMQDLAEKILFATRPHMMDPMKRTFHVIDMLVIRVLMSWKAFDAIPLEGAVSYADLASKVDAEESILKRLVWVMVSRRILTQVGENLVAHTDISREYRQGTQQSYLFLFYYDEILASCIKMPEYFARYGRREPLAQTHTPFSFGHGEPGKTVWEIAHESPERLRRVMEAMGSVQLGPMVAASYDFGWVRGRVAEAEERDRVLFVDVGGGKGHVTKAVLAQNAFIPRHRAVLEDREEVVRAVAEAGEPGLEGVRLQGHDFHNQQPVKNALIYFICRCIHDYGDETAVKMMRHLRDAMAPDSKLLIAECVMSDPPTSFETMMDFTMIDLGGKERTAKEWAELAARAGMRVENIHGVGREIQVVECVKV
ncbi:o-methyltransferase [Colletotrichum sojae]|uniref:O-methyltransferase n=1 Tax=Colletotrichum sojae TaxID=2175907 RepID=A0A8H6ISV4_9PEZI|nr:o-methyltransferase [Colletotrichum sojae]